MAGQSDETAEERARRVVDVLSDKIPITAVVLYGSQATGTADEWSDVDVAVFTPVGKHLSLQDETRLRMKVHEEIGLDVEVIFLPAEDFPTARKWSFAQEVLRTGKRKA
ncbi:MAG: nucleotidyltransferase domain-containing protein [Armatimonadetes bacterium]|nr:nucleotidyltransferase domain-containing protein [Armatimonadota bacterium]